MSYPQHPMHPVAPHPAIDRIQRAAASRNRGKVVSTANLDNVDPALLDAYDSGQRVKVIDVDGRERTGRVSVSMGWCPILLLIHRSNSVGSSDVLGGSDRVIGWWDGRTYYTLDGTPAGANLEARREQVMRPVLKINGTAIQAQGFVYDDCHKIYLLVDDDDRQKMIARGWEDSDIHPLSELPAIWDQTCPLRFISGTGPDYKTYVEQGEDAAVVYS